MDMKNLTSDLKKLGANLDDVEEAVQPLIDNFSELSSELPLLDKAKLMVLTAYTIESLLFSALRLQGINAADHEIMTELKRVKQYFGKIQKAEETSDQRKTTVNTEAATRILKADLGDNKDLKKKLEEKLAEARAKALLKSIEHDKSASAAGKSGAGPSGKKQKGGKRTQPEATSLTSRPKQKKRKT